MNKARGPEIVVTELLPNLLPFIGVIDLGHIIFNALNTGALTLGAWPMFVVPIVLLTLLFGTQHDQRSGDRGPDL